MKKNLVATVVTDVLCTSETIICFCFLTKLCGLFFQEPHYFYNFILSSIMYLYIISFKSTFYNDRDV